MASVRRSPTFVEERALRGADGLTGHSLDSPRTGCAAEREGSFLTEGLSLTEP